MPPARVPPPVPSQAGGGIRWVGVGGNIRFTGHEPSIQVG